MDFQSAALAITVNGVKLGFSLALGFVAAVGGMAAFDRLTRHIEEWQEIKKGNAAMGIWVAALLLVIGGVAEGVIYLVFASFDPSHGLLPLTLLFLVGVGEILLAVVLVILSLYAALLVVDYLTPDLNEAEELRKGNLAVAFFLAGIVLVIGRIVSGPILDLIRTIHELIPFVP